MAKTKKANKPPQIRKCGAVAVHYRLLETYPQFRRNQLALENAVNLRMAAGLVARAGKPTIIPVVVHVVFKQPNENISTAQVKSQIAVLNKDYNATNPDKSKTPGVWQGLVTAAKIQFKLASKDPKGK